MLITGENKEIVYMNSLHYTYNLPDGFFISLNKMFRKLKENQVFFIVITDHWQLHFCT